MALMKEALLAQIDGVLSRTGQASATEGSARCLALLDRLAPGSTYAVTAHQVADQGNVGANITLIRLRQILQAFRADVEAGYTQTVSELLHAEVFEDFLG